MPKISELGALTTPASGDLIPIVDLSLGVTKKIALSDCMSSVFNVDQYGAVGDGTTDDAAAIASTIEAAGANGIVHFTSGNTYLIKTSCYAGLDRLG